MKIIKPMSMGLLHKPYQQGGRQHLVVVGVGFFALGEDGVADEVSARWMPEAPARLLPEAAQWAPLLAALPAGQPLDEVMPKAHSELLVLGAACAPRGTQAATLPVRLQLARQPGAVADLIDKQVLALGPRRWQADGRGGIAVLAADAVARVPLAWEQVCGGVLQGAMPQGAMPAPAVTSASASASAAPTPAQGLMPQLELISRPNALTDDGVAVAALGPLPLDWSSRRRHAGTYDAAWARDQRPGLPLDLDWRLYNRASPDQWLPQAFTGGEAYALHGMHPDHAVLRGRLPLLRVRAFVLPEGAEPNATPRELSLAMDTVWLLPEAGLGVAVWRGQIEVADSDALDVHALMLCYEDAHAAPRPLTHYAEVMRLRLDPETAALHAFNESQLAPARTAAERAQVAAQDAQHAQQVQQRQTAMSAALRAEMAQAAAGQGAAAVAAITCPSSPPAIEANAQTVRTALADLQAPGPASLASGDFDLSAFLRQAQAVAAKAQAWGEAQRQALPPVPASTASSPATAPADPGPQSPTWPAVLLRARLPAHALEAGARRAAPTPLAHAAPLPPELATRLGQQIQAWADAGVPLAGRDFSGADLRGARLAGIDFSGCLFEHADLSDADLTGCNLTDIVLTQAKLHRADLSGADFSGANLCGSHAHNARLRGANLARVQARQAQWAGVDARGSHWSEALLDEADFSGANLQQARFDDCVFNQARWPRSQCQHAHFRRCVGWKLQAAEADFSGTHWQRSALIQADLQRSLWHGAQLLQLQGGPSDWRGARLTQVSAKNCAWTGATLCGADLSHGRFIECDFSRADLGSARLAQACFARSLFLQTQMPQADAGAADFFQALLRKTDLQGADLRGASLYQAELTGANFKHARTEGLQLDALRRLA